MQRSKKKVAMDQKPDCKMWMLLGDSENLENIVRDGMKMTGMNDWEADL